MTASAALVMCETPEHGVAVPHDLGKVALVQTLLESLKQHEELIWWNARVNGSQYTSLLEAEVTRAMADLGQFGTRLDIKGGAVLPSRRSP